MNEKKVVLTPLMEDGTTGARVEVLGVTKRVRRRKYIIHDISLVVRPNEFVLVVGQSGSGKTTLVDAIAGFRPATYGKVFVDGIEVYRNINSMRGKIGYVPQRDIIHMELTVYQALDFSARLRLPPRTTRLERQARILKVLDELGLKSQRNMRISELSGGQQKRVSIGVELLTQPRLFFLDEPTSGLDPGNEKAFMYLMRQLADQGRTLIMITHMTKNIMLADKVVFMNDGYLAWYGPPAEALKYFAQFQKQRQMGDEPLQFDDIYALLDDPTLGDAKDWAGRYQASDAYVKYIEGPLRFPLEPGDEDRTQLPGRTREGKALRGTRQKVKRGRKIKQISGLRQFFILSWRNLTILGRDRASLILMLLIAPAVGSIDFIVAHILGKNCFDYNNGNAVYAGVTLFLLCVYALMVGAMSQMREFVKEATIYLRERLVNLRVFPYVASKVWVALLLAFYHALAFTVLHYLAFQLPLNWLDIIATYITLVLAVMTGMMLGLMASAISNNPGVTPLVLICIVVPMFVFSGGMAPVPDYLSAWASTRWSLQSLNGISGMGSDVMRDSCWQLSSKLRDELTLADKTNYQCPCMGLNMFNQNSCNFPGLGALKVPQITAPAPQPPASLAEAPPEPTLPSPPAPIQDTSNQVEVVNYLNALKKYQSDVTAVQDSYRTQMNIYQATANIYQSKMLQYQEDMAAYTVARVTAVSAGEALIYGIKVQIDWAWVDKGDPQIYYPWLYKTWLAQVILVMAYFFIMLILVRMRDIH